MSSIFSKNWAKLNTIYRIYFAWVLIFAEFVISLKSPKIDTTKNKPYHTSLLSLT